jgi:hypothetical protein
MSTQEQIEANRQNGKLSKGPKTAEGKAVSANNARKHGLLSVDIVPPTEDNEKFSEFAERLHEELKPESELESMLVERIIAMAWRLRRLGTIEAGILIWQYGKVLAERANEQVRASLDQLLPDSGSCQLASRTKDQEAGAQERNLEDRPDTETATLGLAFVRDGQKDNAFAKLPRYETSIERSLFKALHELQRLQAARRGQYVPAPVAVDIDVTGLPEQVHSA